MWKKELGLEMLREYEEYIIDLIYSSKNLRVAPLEQSDFKAIAYGLETVDSLAGVIYL